MKHSPLLMFASRQPLIASRAALKLYAFADTLGNRRFLRPWCRNSFPCHFVSLLHYASISGWERTVDLLLDHGADPRQTCMTGETALHFAVSLRHGKAAETLLKRSQDLVNEADKVRVFIAEQSPRTPSVFSKISSTQENTPFLRGKKEAVRPLNEFVQCSNGARDINCTHRKKTLRRIKHSEWGCVGSRLVSTRVKATSRQRPPSRHCRDAW